MTNLYERLKPEVYKELVKNKKEYKFSVNIIIAKLKSTDFYSKLTIDDVNTLQTFSTIEAGSGYRDARWDYKFGDIWFFDLDEYKFEMDNIEKDKILIDEN